MLIRYASAILNIAGGVALLLGLLFWNGIALHLISLHMLLGLLTVGALWVIAGAHVMIAGGRWPLPACALLVGVVTIHLGIEQTTLMPGAFHWIIQVIHLILGVLTIGFGHMLKKND